MHVFDTGILQFHKSEFNREERLATTMLHNCNWSNRSINFRCSRIHQSIQSSRLPPWSSSQTADRQSVPVTSLARWAAAILCWALAWERLVWLIDSSEVSGHNILLLIQRR